MTDQRLFFNGINAATGDYLLPPLTEDELGAVALGQADPELLARLTRRHEEIKLIEDPQDPRRQLVDGDPRNLTEAGWGVVIPVGLQPVIRYALDELLEYRRGQIEDESPGYYQELTYRPGESVDTFRARHGAGPGAVDPERLPYYLMLVGDPETIPFAFQSELDVQHGVGRLWLDRPEDYRAYARHVVAAEEGRARLPRRLTFFGAVNPGDPPTAQLSEQLLRPLANRLTGYADGWEVREVVGAPATKAQLARLMGGDETPGLLFTGTHGVGFPPGDERQRAAQGALVCQDWPGPDHGELDSEHYFAAADLGEEALLRGLMVFLFACYGAGTPARETTTPPHLRWPDQLAPHDFIARLPQRLLTSGALAVVGHVDRAWSTTFSWTGDAAQGTDFEGIVKRLLRGHPIGSAVELLNQRYAELGAALSVLLANEKLGQPVQRADYARLWRASADARNYVVLGDPAVRLPQVEQW